MGRIASYIEKRYSLADLDRDMDMALYGAPSRTGIHVSNATALRHVTYFDGLRLISETVGQVPLIEYRRVKRSGASGKRGKERAIEEQLYFLLHDEPNPEMDAMSFKSAMQGHAVSWGNAFAEIDWDMKVGEPRALWPLNVSKMKVGRDERTNELIYVYTLPDGTTKVLPAWRVWHLSGFGFNGIVGYDPVYQMRETLGLAMALQENAAGFFGNGTQLSGILTHPNQLSKPAKERMRDSWEAAYQGLEQGHRVAILDEGITYKDIGIPPNNAQFLESREFSIVEMAQLLNLQPHMLKDLKRATFNNIEQLALEFLKYSMGPWFRRWEHACNRRLILPGEKKLYFCEFLREYLLQADSKTRAAFYKELFYMSAISPNEIRDKENMNPIDDEGGDRFYVQQNLMPMDRVDDVILKQTQNSASGSRTINLEDAVRTVAEREKDRIQRAARRDPDNFSRWLEAFYRDFPEYIERQMTPVLGDGAATLSFVDDYVQRSKAMLDGVKLTDIDRVLEGWEDRPE